MNGGKKTNGRKRYMVVDTQGLVLVLKVHAANIADCDGAVLVISGMPDCFPGIQKLCTDSSHNGSIRTWTGPHP